MIVFTYSCMYVGSLIIKNPEIKNILSFAFSKAMFVFSVNRSNFHLTLESPTAIQHNEVYGKGYRNFEVGHEEDFHLFHSMYV